MNGFHVVKELVYGNSTLLQELRLSSDGKDNPLSIQVTCTKLHYLKSFQSCHQGLYCPALSDSRGREEVDVGFNLLKIFQLIFCVIIYNRWYWVAFLGANMFEVHPGQTVPFIHQ